ncbi:periplasmic binding protein-like I [Rhizoclosmatium globosum]|uniref:Periplasmic binding protein-like I n=1 Tax=Rhizoclosmatium globosum TaxID=329046 RepID=A0A1Y2BZQ4_9FUNG|nr:periplasmic binding protein-like I [Rhizoclosmatium globosum]|eukprot:ORY40239.1 periplasmic binding protein-like I [Rhizoclosmatium globosum]
MSGNTYFEDLAIAIAIDDINKDNNLLQNITVGMKRFSDCGAYYPQVEHYNGGFTGLVGTEVVNNVVSNNDVIGVIGAEFSSAIVISAEEFSLHEIPYCSALIGSPRFSDKNKYPFFFRTFASMTGFGQIIFQLLDVWNVKRVALIVQKDDEVGLASGRDMRRFLERNGIIILADLQLSSNIDKLTCMQHC